MRIYDTFCYKKDTQESEFKKFLMVVHASNVEELPYCNVAVICNEECAEFKCAGGYGREATLCTKGILV